jgi:signal transduction histidine kinase
VVGWITAALAALSIVLLGVIAALFRRGRHLSAARSRAEQQTEEALSRLRTAQDALESAESAAIEKEQLAAIGELSAMIAHEIRNPLTIIGNAVSTLRRKETTAEDRATLLDILEEEAGRLNRFVSELLNYARPVSLHLQQIELSEVVVRALALVPPRADLEVEMIEPEPVGKVMGDANLLRQVFENLILNAAQAMLTDGGSLTVRIAPSSEHGIAGVDVVVEDTGEGMDTSVRDRALLPFFTTRPSGTGLGLAIVARFVRAHGGKLEIKSAAGTGTSVRVFLPQEEPPLEPGKSHMRIKRAMAAAGERNDSVRRGG